MLRAVTQPWPPPRTLPAVGRTLFCHSILFFLILYLGLQISFTKKKKYFVLIISEERHLAVIQLISYLLPEAAFKKVSGFRLVLSPLLQATDSEMGIWE